MKRGQRRTMRSVKLGSSALLVLSAFSGGVPADVSRGDQNTLRQERVARATVHLPLEGARGATTRSIGVEAVTVACDDLDPGYPFSQAATLSAVPSGSRSITRLRSRSL